MSFFKNAVADDRVREYVPAVRILASEKTSGQDVFVNNQEVQFFLWGKMPVCRIQPGGWVLIDFGVELHGGVRISSVIPGSVRVRFGESASEAMQNPDQEHSIHDTPLLLPRYGSQEYGNTAFRFVRIDSLEQETVLELQNVIAVALYRNLEWVGSFESSDERLNRIWKTGAYTVQLNMQDYIYDGAKRDRLLWMGDLNPEIRTILSVFSDTSLIPKTLDYLRDHTPLPDWMNGTATYSFWFVISHWEYYEHTGNLQYLAEQKEYIRNLLERLSGMIGDDGVARIDGWCFLDWPTQDNPAGTSAGVQGLLYWMFQCGEKIGLALQEDFSFCKAAVQKLGRYIPDCGDCKAAAALLTLSGLTDRTDVLLQNPLQGVSTFYGCYMLFAQPTGSALEIIRRFWGAMLDYGATTFWEDFNLDWIKNTTPISELPVPGKDDLHADFGAYCYKGLRHSLCHGWASGPTAFLSRRVLGVRYLEPGGKKIELVPDLGDLEYVQGTYPTVYGPLTLHLEKGKKAQISAPSEIEIIHS